jgi:hypothetical protein
VDNVGPELLITQYSRIGGQAASVPEDKSKKQCRDTSAPPNRIAAAHYVRLRWWDVVNTKTLYEIGEIIKKVIKNTMRMLNYKYDKIKIGKELGRICRR